MLTLSDIVKTIKWRFGLLGVPVPLLTRCWLWCICLLLLKDLFICITVGRAVITKWKCCGHKSLHTKCQFCMQWLVVCNATEWHQSNRTDTRRHQACYPVSRFYTTMDMTKTWLWHYFATLSLKLKESNKMDPGFTLLQCVVVYYIWQLPL